MTVRASIIDAVRARLAAIPGLAWCELMSMTAPSDYPALSIDDLGQAQVETDATHSTYTLNLQLGGFVQAPPQVPPGSSAGAIAHAAANDLYAAAVRALFAAPDRLGEVAGGVVQSITEGALFIDVSALASARTIAFTLDVDIQFINRSHDPSLA
jgi:hypothetical protein